MRSEHGVGDAGGVQGGSARRGAGAIVALAAAAGLAVGVHAQVTGTSDPARASAPSVLVTGERLVSVADTPVVVSLGSEVDERGERVETFAVALDGRAFSPRERLDTELALRSVSFDPRKTPLKSPDLLKAKPGSELALVQFATVTLEAYLQDIRKLGGTPLKFVPGNGYIVRIAPEGRAALAERGYVRWLGEVDPAIKLDEKVAADALAATKGEIAPGLVSYHVMMFEDTPEAKAAVVQAVRRLGGRVETIPSKGRFLTASLTATQAAELAAVDQVLFIDELTPIGFDGTWPKNDGGDDDGSIGYDMALIREATGATYLRDTLGFTGQGVRGELGDNNVRATHVDFQANPIIFHTPRSGTTDHGTQMMGIIFGTGTGDPTAVGMMPGAQAIFADTDEFQPLRPTHSAELVLPPYQVVFQSNSWGSTQTPLYTTKSAEMDDIGFDLEIVFSQSMSNLGNQNARPEAWAKNVLANGAILGNNTLSTADDCWCSVGSVGPASDGRIKPELANIGNFVYTTADFSDTSYGNTCCTSAATATNAGIAGLFAQIWHSGILGNPVGPSVFESRPKASFTKAMLINTANQWTFTSPSSENNRYRQGWGQPNLRNIIEYRKPVLVNETEVLTALDSRSWNVTVDNGDAFLKATMAYSDPAAAPFAGVHRVNDLTLRVTSPGGTVYWGNIGLVNGMWSMPGGSADTLNTVENVFVQNPQAGVWQITVIASAINEDAHVETPGLDADFSLVVTQPPAPLLAGFDIFWNTIDGGGTSLMAGGNFEAASTTGQPDAGTMAGGDFRLAGGFWTVFQGPGCAGDANGDGRTDAADLSVLLGQFGQSVSPGTGADFNSDGVVNAADLSVLLANFGCPI